MDYSQAEDQLINLLCSLVIDYFSKLSDEELAEINAETESKKNCKQDS